MHRATAAAAPAATTTAGESRSTATATTAAFTTTAAAEPVCDGHVRFIEPMPRGWALWESGWTLL